MAKAFQCDRCKRLFIGNVHSNVSLVYRDIQICNECYQELKMFLNGAELGLSGDEVDQMFNILNGVWSKITQKDVVHMDCSECYHRCCCGSYSGYSDASQCKLFVPEQAIQRDTIHKLECMKAIEQCLKLLDSHSGVDNRDRSEWADLSKGE